ncbi:MAG TPA: hypothetical protein VNN19_00345 [bacterium]|nr:hypothetical protein [bacterium]
MTGIGRCALCLAITGVVFLTPAPAGAQTTCEYGAAMTPAEAGAAAATGAEAPSGGGQEAPRPALGGLGDLFGAAGRGVVEALGGDTSEIDRAMEEQRQREQEVSAILGTLAALPC